MQIKKNRWLLGATAALTGVALAASGSVAAHADPVGTPIPRLLSGGGSDTTQDVNNGLASVITYNHDNNTSTPELRVLGSYNATNPTTGLPGDDITTNNAPFLRPNGSGNGVTALKSAKDTTTIYDGVNLPANDLQFARSSSGTAFTETGAYRYIPLAVDAVTFAAHSSNTVLPADSSGNKDIPLGTTVGEDANGDGILDLTLVNIYGNHGSTVTSFQVKDRNNAAAPTLTVGQQSLSAAQIVPFIPQAGSGTRSFWQSQIPGGFGPQVSDTYNSGTSVQEHDGAVLNVTSLRNRAIVPFSIAQHIAQSKVAANAGHFSVYSGVTVANRLLGATLGEIDSATPLQGTQLNPGFPVRRPVFTVVQAAEYDNTAASNVTGAQLRATFGGASAKVYQALRPGSSTVTVLADFGFGTLASGTIDFVINGQTRNNVLPGEVSNRFRATP